MGRRAETRRRLRILRAGLNYSQIEVERRSGLPSGRYWDIENGYAEPTDDEKKSIAKVLKTTADAAFPVPEKAASA